MVQKDDLTPRNKESLLQATIMIDTRVCLPHQISAFMDFADKIMSEDDQSLKVAAADVRNHFWCGSG